MESTKEKVLKRELNRHEQALEICCPHIWQAAAHQDSQQAWARAYDQFAALEIYLRHLSVTPAAEAVADLKGIAGLRAAYAGSNAMQQTAA